MKKKTVLRKDFTKTPISRNREKKQGKSGKKLKARIDTFFSKAEWDNPDKIP